jgi:hypothetical protein
VPASSISYPALPPLDPPNKEQPADPKTPTSSSSIPVPTPIKTSRKAQAATSMPGAFGIPSDFAFDFKSDLGEYGRKILEEVKDKARDYRAQMENDPITPPSHLARSPSKQSVTTARKGRFSDAHKEQFAKMESIADHYAVKKTKVVTPQNPQKGIKRTQSQATLDGKSPVRTPSPVKKQRDQELAMQQEEGRRSKRVKMEPVSSFSAKIGNIVTTPKNKSGPLTSAARTAAASRISRPLPALPRAAGIEPTIKLVPSTMPPRSPSKIPVTPSFRRLNIAPATVAAAPKFSLPKVPQTAAPKAAANVPSVDTPEQSKTGITAGGVKSKAVEKVKKSEITTTPSSDKMSLPRTHIGVLSPVKITETVELEDPFASSDLRKNSNSKEWGFLAPAGNPVLPEFPKVPTHEPWSQSTKPQPTKPQVSAQPLPAPAVNNGSKKRKEMDSAPAETGKDDVPSSSDATKDECATPNRKRARFDPAAAAAHGAKNVVEKGKALLDKARLDFLATPKRRVERLRGAKSAVKKGAKKPTWK